MKCFRKVAAALLITPALAFAHCVTGSGGGMDIITKACYSCIFPLRIAGVQVAAGPLPDPSENISSPVCVCANPFPRIGIPISYFEPSRVIETVSDPWCFPSMGFGLDIGAGLGGGTVDPRAGDTSRTFFQAHFFVFPIFSMLELMTDFVCMDNSPYDLGYTTEIDILWSDDTLAAIIEPEGILFGNPEMADLCIGDSIASQVHAPIDFLFWCKGSWGPAYPLTGNIDTNNFVEDAASAAASLIYKLHRQLVLWGSYGNAGLCGQFPAPIWRKSAYRLQPVVPVPHPIAVTIGESGVKWTTLKNPPGRGDNFGFLIFKKRSCCAF